MKIVSHAETDYTTFEVLNYKGCLVLQRELGGVLYFLSGRKVYRLEATTLDSLIKAMDDVPQFAGVFTRNEEPYRLLSTGLDDSMDPTILAIFGEDHIRKGKAVGEILISNYDSKETFSLDVEVLYELADKVDLASLSETRANSNNVIANEEWQNKTDEEQKESLVNFDESTRESKGVKEPFKLSNIFSKKAN